MLTPNPTTTTTTTTTHHHHHHLTIIITLDCNTQHPPSKKHHVARRHPSPPGLAPYPDYLNVNAPIPMADPDFVPSTSEPEDEDQQPDLSELNHRRRRNLEAEEPVLVLPLIAQKFKHYLIA
ncbi:hypothetical protein PGTUg99_000083 [Puccinia graminis f. sp. tritici]|uniref:Uncharacterized protein n=1 Tax=Puccinia graminis f. sp. tritici TaxID=56615 RepID=A0A5B0LL63_PUCGR|nr:hypothetical protein PGTUg99_000083 [Puccinia graminis f. sp. tritici]